VSALADVNPRYPAKKGRKYPFVEMASVGENFAGILKFDLRQLEGSGLSRFKVSDTLFAKITPCPENGKVAFVNTMSAELGLGSTEFIVLSPKAETDPLFLFHLACSHAVRGRAAARMEGSTGRQRVPEKYSPSGCLSRCRPQTNKPPSPVSSTRSTRRWNAHARHW
jgi:type I restriction enzyme, S subunit